MTKEKVSYDNRYRINTGEGDRYILLRMRNRMGLRSSGIRRYGSRVFSETASMQRCVSGICSVVGVVVLLAARVGGSEFPERECCDPVYPPNTATTAAAPITPPISKLAGPGIKGTMAILNCLLARQLCFEDASCSAILEIIPRVCGSELGRNV
ncbi:uncharacterized protein LOC119189321 [Manduca sexta]|uniref:uncharacterized protein LOC119189321 n=1 Tax=Manduca sexta TaxID=7130 RepID=UPI00188F1D13|nr:uncharacterized protein LOC119189321 [Manduca sexta]